MSSILRALRKLEDDKATRRPDELKIDSEILRTGNSPGFSPAGIVLIALLLLACGSGTTYLYMTHGKPPGSELAMAPPITARQQLPSPQAPVIEPEKLPEEIVIVPAQQPNTAKAEEVERYKFFAPAGTARDVAGSKPARPARQADTPLPALPSPPAAAARTVPHLRVNGIAFQDGMDSVAMINDVPVSRGSVIDGVKIEDILKDRVRFSYNGELFEIDLGQSNR